MRILARESGMPMAAGKVLISLPLQLQQQADELAREQGLTRSELIRRALKQYLAQEHRLKLRREMQRGYIEMARINQALADEAAYAECEALEVYEQSLRSVNGDD